MEDDNGPKTAIYCAHSWVDAAILLAKVREGIETFQYLPDVVKILEAEELRFQKIIDDCRARLVHAFFGPTFASLTRGAEGIPATVECGGVMYDCLEREA